MRGMRPIGHGWAGAWRSRDDLIIPGQDQSGWASDSPPPPARISRHLAWTASAMGDRPGAARRATRGGRKAPSRPTTISTTITVTEAKGMGVAPGRFDAHSPSPTPSTVLPIECKVDHQEKGPASLCGLSTSSRARRTSRGATGSPSVGLSSRARCTAAFEMVSQTTLAHTSSTSCGVRAEPDFASPDALFSGPALLSRAGCWLR